jgi:hypothetical protein
MTTPSDGQFVFGEPDDDQPAPPSRCPRCRGSSDCWLCLEDGSWICGRCHDLEAGAIRRAARRGASWSQTQPIRQQRRQREHDERQRRRDDRSV